MKSSRKLLAVTLAALAAAGGIFTAFAADEEATVRADMAPRPRMTILRRSESVLGKPLLGAAGERAGRIVDVVADRSGQVRAAIVDFGGFLGVGTRKIAVDWADLRFAGDAISVDLTKERLGQAPEVREGRPVIAISSKPSHDRADAGGAIPSP
jgi:hypothetical protein